MGSLVSRSLATKNWRGKILLNAAIRSLDSLSPLSVRCYKEGVTFNAQELEGSLPVGKPVREKIAITGLNLTVSNERSVNENVQPLMYPV